MGYAKVIHKKEKKRRKSKERIEKKWTSVQIIKKWVLRCSPEKKR
jgi:hypothetical protein